jgi:hypothetical protein
VYALHGEIYLQRLASAKAAMQPDAYRDHVAGASMHKANGYAHMARCAHARGLTELGLPSWGEPRALTLVSAQAVADLRLACTLRSEKYGQKNGSENTVKAYQAALRNLGDALEIHADLSGWEAGEGADAGRMAAWLRDRATNLALTSQQLLVACAAGAPLGAADARLVLLDLRLAETAAGAVARPRLGEEEEEEAETEAARRCARCDSAPPTHIGFTCRCLCLCEACVEAHAGARVVECPRCGDFTEFVRR